MRRPAGVARASLAVGLAAATLAVPFGLTSTQAASRHLIYCYGTVSKITDGDTLNVHLTSACPGGSKGHLLVVRNAGIQATEISHAGSKAQCWSAEGWAKMRSLIHAGSRVRLSSYYATLNPETDGDGRKRYIKYVDGWVGGKWVDVQDAEIAAGVALYKSEPIETARLPEYARAQEDAMVAHLGMWGNPGHCSTKYDDGAQFRSWIVWKTDGPDTDRTAREESFNVKNIGSNTVNLSHWKIRDASHRFAGGTYSGGHQRSFLDLPAGTYLKPGQTLVIHPAHGHDRPAQHVFFDNDRDYSGHNAAYFPDAPIGHGGRGAHPTNAATGTALFLLDPAENFRAWAQYPCVTDCGMPPPLKIWAQPGINDGGHEYVRITNTSRHAVSLATYVVDMDGSTKNLHGSLPAHKTLTIHCKGQGRSTPYSQYWNNRKNTMSNVGGTIFLRTPLAT